MIMYRAKVDSVSGTKVLAGGKWLTCIGNKNVKAGDFIWTDGRCVYGNFQEAQSPIVITPNDEYGIPLIGAYANYIVGFFDIQRKEFYHETGTEKYWITNNRNIVCKKSQLPLNVDAKNNFYTINFTPIQKNNVFYHKVDIIKNEEIVNSFDTSKEVYSAQSLIPSNVMYNSAGGKILSPFIENENNWYFFLEVETSSYVELVTGEHFSHFDVYLINNTGIQMIATSTSSHTDGLQQWENYQGLILPLHDGFSYEITKIILSDGNLNSVQRLSFCYADIDIHTPNNLKIHLQKIPATSIFAAYEISKKKILFLINLQQVGTTIHSGSNFIEGLYFYNNGKIENLCSYFFDNEETNNEETKNRPLTFFNTCLRPIKNYKNWWIETKDLT